MISIDEPNLSNILDLFKSGYICGWWRSQKGSHYTLKFEEKFAEFNNTKYAVVVSNGTSSIYIALRACGVKKGDLVAVSPYTHIGSLAPIILSGAKPIFIDIDNFGNINPREVEKSLQQNDIKAIVAAHQTGIPCELDELIFGIPIIEDCSMAMGAEYKGKKVGSIGTVGCYSIGGDMTKPISTGEGGIIVTDNESIAEYCRNIRNHGEKNGADYSCFNFRMSNIQAAIGLVQMETLPLQLEWQIKNAKTILSQLPNCLEVIEITDHIKSSYQIIGTRYKQKNGCKSRLHFLKNIREKGLDECIPRKTIGIGYSQLLYEIPFYQRYKRKCKKAEKLMKEAIWIDWHRYPITQKEVLNHLIPGLNEAAS